MSLTLQIILKPNSNKIKLYPVLDATIPLTTWSILSQSINSLNGTMWPCSPLELKYRWEQRFAVCIIHHRLILGYLSVVPSYNNKYRHLLAQRLDLEIHALPILN